MQCESRKKKRKKERKKEKSLFFVFSWSEAAEWCSSVRHSHLPDLLQRRWRASCWVHPVLQRMQGFKHPCRLCSHAQSVRIRMEQTVQWLQGILQRDPQTVHYRQMAWGGWSTNETAVEEFLEQASKFTPQAARCVWTNWGWCLLSTSWRQGHSHLWTCGSKCSLTKGCQNHGCLVEIRQAILASGGQPWKCCSVKYKSVTTAAVSAIQSGRWVRVVVEQQKSNASIVS